MDQTKFSSSRNEKFTPPSFIRLRQVPDVPEDIDFLVEHLNDLNYDLTKPMSSHNAHRSYSLDLENMEVHQLYSSDTDTQSSTTVRSDRHLSLSAEAGNSTEIDFDECAFVFYFPLFYSTFSSESPYPEVRAAISSVDDPTMPVNTFRMCVRFGIFLFKLP